MLPFTDKTGSGEEDKCLLLLPSRAMLLSLIAFQRSPEGEKLGATWPVDPIVWCHLVETWRSRMKGTNTSKLVSLVCTQFVSKSFSYPDRVLRQRRTFSPEKARALGRPWSQLFGRRQTVQKNWRKLNIDHKCEQYYEQCSRFTRIETGAAIPALSSLLICRMRTSALLGGKRRTKGSDMGEPIRTIKGKLAWRGEHDARLGRAVQVQK